MTKELLEKKLPISLYSSSRGRNIPAFVNTDKQLLTEFFKEEPAMKMKLERLIEYRGKLNLNMDKIEEKIKQKKEELEGKLEGEKAKFEMYVSSAMDKLFLSSE